MSAAPSSHWIVHCGLASVVAVFVACSASGRNGAETTFVTPQESFDAGQDAGLVTSGSEFDAGPELLDAGVLPVAPDVVVDVPIGPTDTGAIEPAGPRFPIVPMHMRPAAGATGEDTRVDLELRTDGTLYSHGELVGQISGDRVMGLRGREILTVSPDGVVSLHGTATRIRILENGDISMPNGSTLAFGDDGTPLNMIPGQAPRRGLLQLLGFRAEARRTAGLLAIIVATVSLPHGH